MKITKYILFTINLFDYMGFTITATIFPALLLNPYNNLLPISWSHTECLFIIGVLIGLYPLGQFFSATVLGSLSDIYGRKKILLICLIGTTFSTLFCALAIDLKLILLLFFARFITGLFAGNIAITQASIVDISNTQSKAANISLLQLSLGLAWVAGPFFGSILSDIHWISWFGSSTPLWLLTLLFLLISSIVLFFYKETLTNFKSVKIQPLKSIQHIYQAFTNKNLRSIFLIWMVFIGGWSFFLQFLPTFLFIHFHYTTTNIGPLLAFMGGTFAATQLTIAKPILKRVTAENVLKFSMLIPALATISIALSTNWLFFYLSAFLFPFSMGFTLPSLLTAISNRGEQHEQGLLLGMAGSIQALITVIVTITGGELLALNQYTSTIGAGLMMITGWLLFILLLHKTPESIIYKIKGVNNNA